MLPPRARDGATTPWRANRVRASLRDEDASCVFRPRRSSEWERDRSPGREAASTGGIRLGLVEKRVRNGGGAMPPISSVLSDREIAVVAHYVVEQIAPKG
jgi:hypothetical protein